MPSHFISHLFFLFCNLNIFNGIFTPGWGFFFKEFEEFFSSEDIKSIHNSLVTIGVTKRFVCFSKVRVSIIKVRMMSI
jgi:hypothetical protein